MIAEKLCRIFIILNEKLYTYVCNTPGLKNWPQKQGTFLCWCLRYEWAVFIK